MQDDYKTSGASKQPFISESRDQGQAPCDDALQPDREPEAEQISCHGRLPFCFCFKAIRDRQTALIILTSVLYYFSVALSSFPLRLLINKRIAGDPEDPNSE
jgi:hypothetical protein